MAIAGVKCVRGEISMEEHYQCMLDGAPCGVPPTILEVMTSPSPEREGVVYSPSSIQGCHRQYALKRGHQWFVPVESVWGMTRGTITHHGLGQLPAPRGTLGVVRELRMWSPVKTKYGALPFSGQIDEALLTHVEGGVLHVRLLDYKTKADVPHTMLEPEPRHVEQINYYNFLTTTSLKRYLDGWDEDEDRNPSATLSLREPLPEFREVVVDEMQISYLGGNKVRTFTTSKILSVHGKQRGTRDKETGIWHRYVPIIYEVLELLPMPMYSLEEVRAMIVSGVEDQHRSETELALPLVGDKAVLMCGNCPVRTQCVDLACKAGQDVTWQRGSCE